MKLHEQHELPSFFFFHCHRIFYQIFFDVALYSHFEAKILILLCVGIIILFSVGCIPLLTGIKKHTHSDGSVTEFITGVDLMVGANGTDTVENTRGIEPGKYTKQ